MNQFNQEALLNFWDTAGITEVLDQKGLREGMDKTHTERAKKADDQLAIFFFSSASFIRKRKRLTHQKHTDLVTTVLF
jgi:hypothetical protein